VQQQSELANPIANSSWRRVIAEAIPLWITFTATAFLLSALP